MVKIKTKLVLKVEGGSMSECEDAVTQWAGARIKARIMAEPDVNKHAHFGVYPDGRPGPGPLPSGLKINPIRMTSEMRESVDKAENKRKQSFEEV